MAGYLNSPVAAKTALRSTVEQEDEHGFYRRLMYRPTDPSGATQRLRAYTVDQGVHGVIDGVAVPGPRSGSVRTLDGQAYVMLQVDGAPEALFMLKEYTRGPTSLPPPPAVTVNPNIQVNPNDLGIPAALDSVEGKLSSFLEFMKKSRPKNRFSKFSVGDVQKVKELLYGSMAPGPNADRLVLMIYEVCCCESLDDFVKADGSRTMVQGAEAVAQFDATFFELRSVWPDLTRQLLFTILRFDFDSFAELHVEHLNRQLLGVNGHVIALYEKQDSASRTNRSMFDEGIAFFQLVIHKIFLEGRDEVLNTPFLYEYAARVSHIEKTQYALHRAVSGTVLRLIAQYGTQGRDAIRRAIKSPGVVFASLTVKKFKNEQLWYSPKSQRYQDFVRTLQEVGAREFGIMALRAEMAVQVGGVSQEAPKVDPNEPKERAKEIVLHPSGNARGMPILMTRLPKPIRSLDEYKGRRVTNLCSEFIQTGLCSRGDSCEYYHVLPSKRAVATFAKNFKLSSSAKQSLLTRIKGVAQKHPDLPAVGPDDTLSVAKDVYA